MRTAVLLSAILLVAGVVLEILAQVSAFPLVASYSALFAVLSAVLVLLATTLANLLPGTAQRLSECQH
jgi:hypothetical protein